MANPLFSNRNSADTQNGGIFGLIANRMYRSNPTFRDFLNSSRGKSISQICSERGIDPNRLAGMTNRDIIDFMRNNRMM